MPNSSLIEQRCTIPSSDRAPRRHYITACSWRPSSPILPGLTLSTPDEVLGTHRDDQSHLVGQIIVRHICATELPSNPRPSLGCLKLRLMISVKSSSLTTT